MIQVYDINTAQLRELGSCIPVDSVILTSLAGLDFLFLVLVVTFFGVLTVKGAVISLYTEASKPSLCGAASGVLKKQAHSIYGNTLDLQNKCCHQFFQLHD